ncbi:MAG: LamG domain-containing protein, partial [Gammaproteobacteria bacterium]
MIESPILSEITTNPTITPATITTAVNDVATGNFASIDLLPNTGNDVGDQAFVQATNRLYIWSGSGWYNIALINTTPTWDSGGQPAGSYVLDADSPQTATTITLAASDPEGLPISYTYVTSGQMDSISTISQDSSVFTITPKTSAQAPDGGTGSITFRASDGVNILPYVSSFTLTFFIPIENSRYTTLLATATGTGDNNDIIDASTNNHSITVNGDAHAGTFSPYRSGGYSTLFGSNTNYGRYELTNNISLTGDFTIEFWFSGTEYTGRNQILGSGFQLRKEGSGWYTSISWPQGSYSIPNNEVPGSEWHWVQLIRSSGSAQLYVDGNTVGSAVANTTTYNLNSGYANKLIIGYEATSERFDGYLRDLRISNVARTAAIPTVPLELDSNTHVLLFNKGAQIAETGLSNTLTLTALGDPESHAIGPYDYLEYSATDHGGSINFDGTGDYLTIPDHSSLNFASNDWTIECWIYPRTNVGDCGIWHQSASGTDWYSIYLDGAFNLKFVFYNASNGVEWAGTAASNTAPQNTWTHVALVRQFGTGVYLYANGKLVASDTLDASVTMLDKTYNHVIGYERFVGSGNAFDGLISDFKMDIGTAHYTGEFTPPTAPLSSTAADLHIKGTDASIIDKSQGSNLKLVNNTTGSTTQVKFAGSKSIYFDGSGDYIDLGSATNFNFGTNSFTIEAWVRFTNLNRQSIINCYDGTDNSFDLQYRNYNNVNHISWSGQSAHWATTPSDEISSGTWYHIAAVRDYSAGTIKIYID